MREYDRLRVEWDAEGVTERGCCLSVLRQTAPNGTMEVVAIFHGEEAQRLYSQLTKQTKEGDESCGS